MEQIYRQAKEGKGRTSRVLFIWIIRDASHIQWISSALQAAFDSEPNTGRPLNVEIRIFITQSESTISAPPGSASTEERHQQSFPMSNNVNRMRMVIDSNDDLIQVVRGGGGTIDFNFGRPEVGKLIEEELAASDGLKVSVDGTKPDLDYLVFKSIILTHWCHCFCFSRFNSLWSWPSCR